MRRRSAATFDGRLAEVAWEPRRAGATQLRPLGHIPWLHPSAARCHGPGWSDRGAKCRACAARASSARREGRQRQRSCGRRRGWLAEWPPVPTLATRPGYPSVHESESVCGGLWERDETDSSESGARCRGPERNLLVTMCTCPMWRHGLTSPMWRRAYQSVFNIPPGPH